MKTVSEINSELQQLKAREAELQSELEAIKEELGVPTDQGTDQTSTDQGTADPLASYVKRTYGGIKAFSPKQ